MKYSFPKNFYWGSSTSSHQVEGNNFNNWSEWEKENAEKLARGAKIRWDDRQKEKFPEMLNPQNYISGRACDHYNRFCEDFDIAKSLGHSAHRFSIEWARIEPEEGKFDEKEIEHYRQVIKALRERDIEPFVTLWHWTLPIWIAEKGGWLNIESPKYFVRYVGKISQEFSDVKFWITLNEPIVYVSHAYLRGLWPPGKKNFFYSLKVVINLIRAHNLSYKLLHSAIRDCAIGVAKNDIYFKSNFLSHYFDDSYFTNRIKNTQDFTAINYYRSFFKKKDLAVSDLDWQIYPEGIYHILKRAGKHKRPIFITENGLADVDDKKRADFLKDHLRWVYKAIQEGVDVRGYLHWSLMDNFEWDKGFWPRFGLVEIDYSAKGGSASGGKTLERKIRPSALEYAKIIKNNGF